MFEWSDKYSVNIEKIDNQHKKLFEIASDIYELASLKDSYDHYDEITKLLNELKDYAVYHFNYEEKLMEQYGYGGLDDHKIEHMFFVKKLNKIEKIDIDNNQNEALLELINFVADWITGHILKSDMEYKPYLNGKGVY